MKTLHNEQGFTLIELMVVVLIIGILVAVAVPVFVNASNNSRSRTCQANLRTLDGAIQTFASVSDADPATLAALVPQYIKRVPSCPVNGAHAYSLLAADASNPAQSAVTCADLGGRNGVEDTNHYL